VGGGPAGAATAIALSREGYSAVVIERSDYRNVRIGETLPPAVRLLLTSLGVWDRFVAENHSPSFAICSAWGQQDLYDNDFIFNPHGSGWHIDRARFDAMLARATEDAGACVYRGARLISCGANGGDWRVESASSQPRAFQARLLVDATGRAAWVAHRQGANRICYDHLVGVAGYFSVGPRDRDACHDTLIEAVEDGWWYSALLPNSQVLAIYMTDADLYAKGSKRRTNYWQKQLAQAVHTRSRVNPFALASGPFVVAANSSRIHRFAGDNWLAVGDAAMAFDPLAAQGISKALQSGVSAAQAIHAHFSGSESAWCDYAADLRDSFGKYMIMRNEYYRREMRWPDSPFWQRRHSPGKFRGEKHGAQLRPTQPLYPASDTLAELARG